MDSAWNPCHDAQAVCRVYRYGQKRKCFVYRLVASGTMERKIYDRQIHKTMLSSHVIDTENLERRFSATELAQLFQYNPTKPSDGPFKDPSGGADPAMAALCGKLWAGLTAVPFEHTSLLLATVDPAKRLTAADKERALRSERLYDPTADQVYQAHQRSTWSQAASLSTFGLRDITPRPLKPDNGPWKECWDRNSRNFYWWLTGSNPPFVTWEPFPWLKFNNDGSNKIGAPPTQPIFQSAEIFQQAASQPALTSATRIGGAAGGRTLVEISDYTPAASNQRPVAARKGPLAVPEPSGTAVASAPTTGAAVYDAARTGSVGASVRSQPRVESSVFPLAADQTSQSVVGGTVSAAPQACDDAASSNTIVL